MENVQKKGRGRPKKIDPISAEEQRRIFYQTFKAKNDVNKTIVCDVCQGKYTYYNKYKHVATMKHIRKLGPN